MTSNDNFISNRQVFLHVLNENLDTSVKNENLLETKLQDIGCCGDVPKISKTTNRKRDKLLEWLKSSQLKREENNRQVFSRWIDMVDNGAIDLTSLSNYPGKPSKQVNICSNLNTTSTNSGQINSDPSLSQVDSKMNVSPQLSTNLLPNSVKPTTIPTTGICPSYFPSINNSNYYGVSQNWFTGNQPRTMYSPIQMPQQLPVGVYSGYGSYCATSPMLGNYYQYIPIQQACTLCPPYVMPTLSGNMDTNFAISPTIQMQNLTPSDNSSSVNIDVNKWFDVLNEIKITQPKNENNEASFQNDSCDNSNNFKDEP